MVISTPRVRVTVAATFLAVLISGSVVAQAAPARPDANPIGNPRGKALLARVHRAYRQVGAIELSAVPRESTFSFPRRFVLILRQGTVVAEEFSRPGSRGITVVARRFGPTYARDAGARCWHRLPSTDPRTLVDVGFPFPYSRHGMKVIAPQPTSFGWLLKSEHKDNYWFLATQRTFVRSPKQFVNYSIDGKSHQIRSIYVQIIEGRQQSKWPVARLTVRTLASSPRLPTPAPVC